MSKTLEAALKLSDLLHGLEERGIDLTDGEEEKWSEATALIESAREQIKNQENCMNGNHEWTSNPFKPFDLTRICKHCGKKKE